MLDHFSGNDADDAAIRRLDRAERILKAVFGIDLGLIGTKQVDATNDLIHIADETTLSFTGRNIERVLCLARVQRQLSSGTVFHPEGGL